MTERERKQRRLARERRMGRYKKPQKSGMFAFRSYVTVVLAGALLVLSFLQTETSLAVCDTVKNTIAYQIPVVDITDAKTMLQALFSVGEDGEMPVLLEEEEQMVSITVTEEDHLVEDVFQYAPDIYESP